MASDNVASRPDILTLGQWADLLLQPVLIAAVLGVLVGCILYAFID